MCENFPQITDTYSYFYLFIYLIIDFLYTLSRVDNNISEDLFSLHSVIPSGLVSAIPFEGLIQFLTTTVAVRNTAELESPLIQTIKKWRHRIHKYWLKHLTCAFWHIIAFIILCSCVHVLSKLHFVNIHYLLALSNFIFGPLFGVCSRLAVNWYSIAI